jgi:5-methylcytosine-specific restriction enzyme A
LTVIRRDPNKALPKRKDGICVCLVCANEKGSRSNREFRNHLYIKRKKLRKDMVDNYKELRKKVFNRYHYQCIYCKEEYGQDGVPKNRKLTIDHKIPLVRGGTNDLKNLCCACEEHNLEKEKMTAQEYMSYLKNKKERTKKERAEKERNV